MKNLSNLKIAYKFSITLIALLIIPIIFISVLVRDYIIAHNFEQSCESRLVLLEQVQRSVVSFTKDVEYVSTSLMGNSSIQTLMKGYSDLSMDSNERQRLTTGLDLRPLVESREFMKAICFYNENGIIYQYGLHVRFEDMQFDKDVSALKGIPYWTSAYKQSAPSQYYFNYIEGEHVVSLLRVINDMYSYQNILGIERITMDEAYICSLYSAINTNGGTMYLVNEKGYIVSATDKSMLGTNISNGDDFSRLVSGSGRYEQGDKVVFYYQQDSPHWSLVMVESKITFMKGDREIKIITYINIVLTLIFGMVFLIVQNRSIIRPVSQLSKDVENYCEGHFIINTYSKSTDEIGNLNRSMQKMSDYITNLIDKEYKSEIKQREIELEYLQSQIRPHFLFNTLDSIRWMALIRKQPEIAEQIEALSKFFRHYLNNGKKYTTLADEIDSLRTYVTIQQLRFADKIHFNIDVDETLLNCKIIKLIIQPLVENAVIHGLESKIEGGYVNIIVDRWDDKLRCRVIDNGVGINAEAIKRQIMCKNDLGRFSALKNIHDRLVLDFGEGYGISISVKKGTSTTVQILLPILIEQGDNNI